MKLFTVMLCVNDPDNGAFTGRVHSIEVDHELISLEGPIEEVDEDLVATTEVVLGKGSITIGGELFQHRGHSNWVGNWCWDAVMMTPMVTLSLLNHLKRLGWGCHLAETGLFERWRQPGDLAMEHLKAAVDAGVA